MPRHLTKCLILLFVWDMYMTRKYGYKNQSYFGLVANRTTYIDHSMVHVSKYFFLGVLWSMERMKPLSADEYWRSGSGSLVEMVVVAGI